MIILSGSSLVSIEVRRKSGRGRERKHEKVNVQREVAIGSLMAQSVDHPCCRAINILAATSSPVIPSCCLFLSAFLTLRRSWSQSVWSPLSYGQLVRSIHATSCCNQCFEWFPLLCVASSFTYSPHFASAICSDSNHRNEEVSREKTLLGLLFEVSTLFQHCFCQLVVSNSIVASLLWKLSVTNVIEIRNINDFSVLSPGWKHSAIRNYIPTAVLKMSPSIFQPDEVISGRCSLGNG